MVRGIVTCVTRRILMLMSCAERILFSSRDVEILSTPTGLRCSAPMWSAKKALC